ncbi:tudor domain-containing protein 1 [Moniliophthora roreri MCA 2997]|uniref:Tudor domain-containing protein 1 n=1 Tax=Moniliophthora roreri (strain MCA 2997) TaxID=1381753 RepID=V2XGX2_MONRO|nr:tudor domain-containing protein 1 [Moniliophthora roreri MCA 2997]
MSTKLKLRTLKSKAQAGSQYALTELGKLVSDTKYLEDVIPAILANISLPIPDSIATLPTRNVILAHTALVTIAKGLSPEELAIVVRRHWSQIWGWMTLLSDSYLNPYSTQITPSPVDHDIDFRDNLHLALLTIMHSLTRTSKTARRLASCRRQYWLTVNLILLAAGSHSCHDPSEQIHRDILAKGVDLLDSMMHSKYPGLSWEDIICDTLNYTPSRLPSGLLHRIIENTVLNDAPCPDYEMLDLSLRMLHMLSGLSRTFNYALMHQRSVFWICNVVKWVSGQDTGILEEDGKMSFIFEYLRCSLGYLLDAITTGGQTAVLQALKAGMLRWIAASAHIVDDEGRTRQEKDEREPLSDLIQALLRLLSGYTVYYSVSLAFPKALRRAEKLLCGCVSLYGDFLELRNVVDDRVAKRRLWDEDGVNVCANKQCPLPRKNPGKRIAFFRCTGCKLDYYCSRDCQKEAWNGHRESCKSHRGSSFTQNGTPKPLIPLDSREKEFQWWLTTRCVSEQRADILYHQSQYRSDNPWIPPDEPVVSMLSFDSYQHPGYNIDTISLAEAKQLSPKCFDWDPVLTDHRIEKDPLVLTTTSTACCPYFRLEFAAAPLSDCNRKENIKFESARC